MSRLNALKRRLAALEPPKPDLWPVITVPATLADTARREFIIEERKRIAAAGLASGNAIVLRFEKLAPQAWERRYARTLDRRLQALEARHPGGNYIAVLRYPARFVGDSAGLAAWLDSIAAQGYRVGMVVPEPMSDEQWAPLAAASQAELLDSLRHELNS